MLKAPGYQGKYLEAESRSPVKIAATNEVGPVFAYSSEEAFLTQEKKDASMKSHVIKKDFCTRDGAQQLKFRIEEYWTKRGFSVHVNLVQTGFVAEMRSARTDIRSDMINGTPQRRLINTSRNDGHALP